MNIHMCTASLLKSSRIVVQRKGLEGELSMMFVMQGVSAGLSIHNAYPIFVCFTITKLFGGVFIFWKLANIT